MKSLVRLAISLLISVVLFAVFAFIAFSGLFDYIESRFYDERIEALEREYVQKAISVIDTFHEENLNRFALLLQNSAMASVYNANSSREQIGTIRNIFELLKIDNSDFLGVRFIDPNGFIHFSTFEKDIQTSTQLVREYKRLIPAADEFSLDRLNTNQIEPTGVLIDARAITGNFIYKLLTSGGTALFYVSARGLVPVLIQSGILDLAAKYSLIHDQGIILKLESGILTALEERVRELWEAGEGIKQFQQIAETESSATLIMYAEVSPLSGKVGSIINEARLVLSPGLKILLLASFFLTTFLIAFLLLSIRQDRVLVLSERIKRFQIEFIKGYVDKRDEINWGVWKRDLNSRKEEVRKNIKKGIGKLKPDRAAEVDALIDKSWSEILDVIGTRIEAAPAPQLQVSNLEDIIRRVVSDTSLLNAVTNNVAKSAASGAISVPVKKAAPQTADAAVETLEEVEELLEVDEAGTDAGLKATPEAAAEAEIFEELEEVEELLEVDEAGTDDAGLKAAPGAVTEAEAVEEFEELEEVEAEGAEAIAAVGLEVTPQAATGAHLEAATEAIAYEEAVEELEEVEELEIEEVLEAVEEPVAVGELEEPEAVAAAELEAAPEAIEELEIEADTAVFKQAGLEVTVSEDLTALPLIETRKDTWELITEAEYQKLKNGESVASIDDVLILPEIDALVKSVSEEIDEYDGSLEAIPISEEDMLEQPASAIGESEHTIPDENVEADFLPVEDEPQAVEAIPADDLADEARLETSDEIREIAKPVFLDLEAEADEDEIYLYAEDGEEEEVDYSKYYDEDVVSEEDALLDEAITDFGDAGPKKERKVFEGKKASPEIDDLELYVEIDDDEAEELEDVVETVAEFGESEPLEDDEIVLIGEKSASSGLAAAIAAEAESETDLYPVLEEVEPLDVSVSSGIAEVTKSASEASSIEKKPQSVLEPIVEVAPLSQEEEIVISVEGELGRLIEVAPLSDELPEPVKPYVIGSAETEEERISIDISRLPDELYEELEELEPVTDRQYRDFSLEQLPVGYAMLSRAFDYQSVVQNLLPQDDGVVQSRPSSDTPQKREIETFGSKTEAPVRSPDRHKDPIVRQLSALMESGVVEMYAVEELKKAFDDKIEPVEFKDGVFQVSDKAFYSDKLQTGSDRQLSELVDAVISEDDEEVMGIDALFSSAASGLDLSLDFLPNEISGQSETKPVRPVGTKRTFVSEGLDFDKYVVDGGLPSLAELKALIKVSHIFDALTAAILVQGEEGLYVEHGIGLEESESSRLCLNYTSSLYEIIFSKRYFVSVKKKKTGISALDGMFKDETTRYFNGSLYMPIVFRGKQAYLFLGLKDAGTDFISRLKDKLYALEKR